MIKDLTPPSIKELQHLVDTFDESFEKIKDEVIKVLILPRIDEIEDEKVLDLLGWQFHIEGWDLARTVEEKRNLIKNAIMLHRHKGTPYAIKKVFEALNLEAKLFEWFEYGGEPYRFKVELTSTDRELSPETINKLRQLIDEYKNVRSWLESIDVAYRTNIYAKSAAWCAGELTNIAEMMPYEFSAFCANFACISTISEITMNAIN